jgi:predicted ATPase
MAPLPASPNSLLGRDVELAELRELLLRDDARLLTLSGAGGSGKTRLVLEAARENAASFANRAAFAEVASVRDPDLLLTAIATALRVDLVGGEPLDVLAAALGPRELLLVIDNVEHLLEGTQMLPELVSRAPRLKILATPGSAPGNHEIGHAAVALDLVDDELGRRAC